jgi:hypothetical protein
MSQIFILGKIGNVLRSRKYKCETRHWICPRVCQGYAHNTPRGRSPRRLYHLNRKSMNPSETLSHIALEQYRSR